MNVEEHWIEKVQKAGEELRKVQETVWRQETHRCKVCNQDVEVNTNDICFDCWQERFYA